MAKTTGNCDGREPALSSVPHLRLVTGGDNDIPPDDQFPGDDQAELGPDMAFTVELWNVARTGIECVLAITRSANIGQGAFYAATRDFPNRYVTLRHNRRVLNTWRGKTN